MKYTLQINQKAVIEAGITGVDAIDLLLFDVLFDMVIHGGMDTEIIQGRQWTWVAYSKMQDELPLLDLSTQTFYRRLNKLCDADLIVKSPTNEDARKVFVALGPKAKLLTSNRHDPYKLEGGTPYKLEGGTPTNLKGYNTTIDTTTNKSEEKETRMQESEKEKLREEVKPIEMPVQKTEQQAPRKISTLDIPRCEGHGFLVFKHEYPQQGKGAPFCHPDLCIERIPFDKRIDVWWALYGVNQGRQRCELLLMQNNMADDIEFAKLYRHTFLYVVSQPNKDYRAKPEKYLKERMWTDDIIDRRPEKDKSEPLPAAKKEIDETDPNWGRRNWSPDTRD